MSLSSRWTIPGRCGSSPPAGQIPEHLDQGGAGIAGRRVDDQAGRLVDHRQELVLPDDPGAEGHRDSGSGPGGSPALAGVRLRGAAGVGIRLGAECVHPDEDDHAERDLDVGEVERGPGAEIDEIGDRTLVDPVDQVADRAAGEQPDRKPEPAAIRCSEEHAEQGCEGDRGEHENQ